MDKKRKIKYVIGAVMLAMFFIGVGLVLGRFVFAKPPSFIRDEKENSKRGADNLTKQFSFINPLLDCSDLGNLSNKAINEMRANISNFVDEQTKQGVIDYAAIYFRDLNNGPWFGIHEKEMFFPASLLKVPLMMNVFKQAISDPPFLNQQFVWHGTSRNNEYFKATKELENNQTYTIDEATSYMIKYSDNNALYALGYAVNTDTLVASYADLGIPIPNSSNYTISARTYASFFRILYNSTFLNNEYSEKALRLLSETVFDRGLVAGVPPSVKVSHKFGERETNNKSKQLNDCGIIYYPGSPYLLCVMVSGGDYDMMASFIAKISRQVYGSMDKNNEEKR